MHDRSVLPYSVDLQGQTARRIDIWKHSESTDRWLCRRCGVGERLLDSPAKRVIDRATLHNILFHRDDYLIRDLRYEQVSVITSLGDIIPQTQTLPGLGQVLP
jgi:hypothetical protein